MKIILIAVVNVLWLSPESDSVRGIIGLDEKTLSDIGTEYVRRRRVCLIDIKGVEVRTAPGRNFGPEHTSTSCDNKSFVSSVRGPSISLSSSLDRN